MHSEDKHVSLEQTVGLPGNYSMPTYMPMQPMYYQQYGAPMGMMGPSLMTNAAYASQMAAARAAFAAQQASQQAFSKMSSLSSSLPGGSTGGLSQGLNTIQAIVNWISSGRYDFPHGENVDFFHNRICFDKVCRHDPEMTNDLPTEWLRRASPIANYAQKPPTPKLVHEMVPKPDQKFSLIPYENLSKSKVSYCDGIHIPNGIELRVSNIPTENVVKVSSLFQISILAIPLSRTLAINEFL